MGRDGDKKMSLVMLGGRWERSWFVLMLSEAPEPLATRVLGLQLPLLASVVQGMGPLLVGGGAKRAVPWPLAFPRSFPKHLFSQLAVEERGRWQAVKAPADPVGEVWEVPRSQAASLDHGSGPCLFQGKASCPHFKHLPR